MPSYRVGATGEGLVAGLLDHIQRKQARQQEQENALREHQLKMQQLRLSSALGSPEKFSDEAMSALLTGGELPKTGILRPGYQQYRTQIIRGEEGSGKLYRYDPDTGALEDISPVLPTKSDEPPTPPPAFSLPGLFQRFFGPRQSAQVPATAPVAPVSRLTSGGGRLRVRRKADGRAGTIPAAEFDPALYDRL